MEVASTLILSWDENIIDQVQPLSQAWSEKASKLVIAKEMSFPVSTDIVTECHTFVMQSTHADGLNNLISIL